MKRDRDAEESRKARSVVLGTAGHIDHGKTALVYALTGKDTDRLPEEKSRGITIDLGFASLDLQDERGDTLHVSLIDVPGHHAFIRNMLAGAGGIECVMLVIAADEGVKAQTREHLTICELLGVRRGLIVLTKKDLVSIERLEQARGEVASFVQHSFLAEAPVVAVSALTLEGISELRAELARVVASVPALRPDRVLRLPLDRVFSVRGFGTVVTGTLRSGRVRAEDLLEVQPQRRQVRVRGVQVHGAARQEARAPNRVALNLAGIEVAEISRGDMLVDAKTLEPVSTVDVAISFLSEAMALKHRSQVRVHAFTSDSLATVLLYEQPQQRLGEPVLARLRLAYPMMLAPQDRFVLRQPSPAATIGGGRVLDVWPDVRSRKSATRDWLQQLKEATEGEQILLRVRRRQSSGVSVQELIRETGFTGAAIESYAELYIASGELVTTESASQAGRYFVSAAALTETCERIQREITRFDKEAVPRAALHSKLRIPEWVLDLATRRLLQAKRTVLGPKGFTLPQQVADGRQNEILAKVERFYAEAGLASPIVSEVSSKLGIPQRELQGLLTQLLRSKMLIRMGADNLLIHADAITSLTAVLREHRGESFNVGRFKDLTGLTRKHAIPLLEYLDGARVTRNNNGVRTVL